MKPTLALLAALLLEHEKREKDRHFLLAIRGVGSYDDDRDALPKWEG